jgi:DNA (cytosine-5)-methyltransferase 1
MSFTGSASTATTQSVEAFEFGPSGVVSRTVQRRGGKPATSSIAVDRSAEGFSAEAAFDLSWLRSAEPPSGVAGAPLVRTVDLFAGCGGLSVGIGEACRALGLEAWPVLANDVDPEILAIYERNFPGTKIVCAPVETLLDGQCGKPPTATEREFAARVGEIDLVIGGPPCQGHSDFNNHTRNDDPKNELYLRMARFCEVVRPRHVIIENVPGVERDKRRVAQQTWAELERLGYSVDSGIVDASRIGVAQKRKRSVTIASLDMAPSIEEAVHGVEVEPRPVTWAIEDLLDVSRDRLVDQAPNPNATSQGRIDYLFDHDLYELPDEQRPDCHRLKEHSYVSVYGRLYPDRPAPTITTGFGVMGRGRFVHPTERRTITPHEAARIQFFPDFFDFGPGPRTVIHKVIGNAVPSKMGYAIGLHLLR